MHKVVFYEAGCIGGGACALANPEYFSMGKEKAILKDSVEVCPGRYELEIGEDNLVGMKEAARVCPAFVIRVYDPKGNSL